MNRVDDDMDRILSELPLGQALQLIITRSWEQLKFEAVPSEADR